MEEFLQQVVSGLASGGIFASLALALVLIYRTTGVVNFAQGEMAMFTHLRRVEPDGAPALLAGVRADARGSRSSAAR